MDMPRRNIAERTDDLLAGASGLLLTAACPDLDLNWLAWIALVPLMAALRAASGRTAFRRGMIAGMVHYMTLIYWLVYTMRTYGGLPWYLAVPPLVLLSAYLSLYLGLFAVIWTRFRKGVLEAAAWAPVLWCGLEYLRSFLFSGFPWGLLGYSQYRNLHLIQISDIFGIYGVSFLLVLGNAAVFFAAACRIGLPWRGDPVKPAHAAGGLCMAFAALAGTLAYGWVGIRSVDRMTAAAPSLRAAVVQGNIDQMIKWDPAFQEETTGKYLALSRGIDPRPDLVVWPETAVPFYLFDDTALTDRVVEGVREIGAHFVIGSPAYEVSGTGADYFNSAYLVTPDGRPAGRYDKVHLVPFGEYVPLQKWLPFIRKLVVQAGDFKTGEKGETLAVEGAGLGDLGLGVLICYEIIFPDLSRAAAANGAGLLVNVTNDAWYGRSSAPYQHFSMAVFRAVENKRALIRAANTGVSGFIDPVGRIEGSTPLFVDAAVGHAVPVLTRKTLYTRTGDWFAAVCLGITVMLSCIATFRRKTP